MKLFSCCLLTLFTISCSNHIVNTRTGLQYSILKKGRGAGAKAGDEILLFETTSYSNGKVLYSNERTGKPQKVLVGSSQLTAAVDEGLRGMKTGEVRQIFAPSYLVKRKSYPSNIDPDSGLVIRLVLNKIIVNR